MTNDKGYDWDNQWGVGFELSQKEHYYHYFNTFLVFFQLSTLISTRWNAGCEGSEFS